MSDETKQVQDASPQNPDAPAAEETPKPKAEVEEKKSAKPKAEVEEKKSAKPKDEAEEKKSAKPKAEVEEKKSAKPKADAEEKKSAKPKDEAEETKAPKAKKEPPAEEPKPSRTAPPLPEGAHYIWGTGRRKASVARVRIRPGEGKFLINKREIADYFPHLKDQETVLSPLEALGMTRSYDIWVNLKGGGWTGQSGAVSLGLARALAKHMPDIESDLRHKGLLTRDARAKERKKPGQPGARKRFQFSKR